MSEGTEAQDYAILRASKQGITLGGLLKLSLRTYLKNNPESTSQALYHQLYRRVNRLVKQDFLYNPNPGGNPKLYTTSAAGLDLLAFGAKFKHPQNKPLDSGQRIRAERRDAIKIAKQTKLFYPSHKEKIEEFFNEYLETIEELFMIFKRKNPPKDNIHGEPRYKVIPYSTRWTDHRRQKDISRRYDKIWDNATARHKYAVHLVLTTNPNLFGSIWDANRHFPKALNRFFARLTRIKGKRPEYLSVYEYTKKGLLHAHIIIFDTRFLLPKHKITDIWEDCGQGTYNYIYALQNDGSKFVYARKRPKDTEKGISVEDYLRKYLNKGMYYDVSLTMFWLFNKRFYTYSRILFVVIRIQGTGEWIFLMSCYAWDTPHAVIQGGTARQEDGWGGTTLGS